jgi:hypothetical protein
MTQEQLTERQATVASGQYPQWTDEQLLATHARLGKSSDRKLLIALVSGLAVFAAMFASIPLFPHDPRMQEYGHIAMYVLAFLCTVSFGVSFLSAHGDASTRWGIEHELERRGVAWKR